MNIYVGCWVKTTRTKGVDTGWCIVEIYRGDSSMSVFDGRIIACKNNERKYKGRIFSYNRDDVKCIIDD